MFLSSRLLSRSYMCVTRNSVAGVRSLSRQVSLFSPRISHGPSLVTVHQRRPSLASISNEIRYRKFSTSNSNEKDDGKQNKQDGQEQNGQERKKGFWNWYTHCLEVSPLWTKALTSGLIVGLGDLFAQLAIEEADAVDWLRAAKMSFIGTVLVGPTLHYWYGALFTHITMPGMAGAAARMAIDQIFFAPFFIVLFSGFVFALDGKLDQLEGHMRATMWDSMLVNWKMWIPAQLINFRFVPPQYQVLFVNFVAFIWNTYLSVISHSDDHASKSKEIE